MKIIYNKLNRRKVLILYPIYPNHLAFQSNNFLIYFISSKGYWAVSEQSWGAVMLLRGIFYKQGAQKWPDLTGDWWHYRYPHVHAIRGAQCQQLKCLCNAESYGEEFRQPHCMESFPRIRFLKKNKVFSVEYTHKHRKKTFIWNNCMYF